MDKNKIIENGLLERYLTGELPEDLCHELEQVLKKDASLKQLYSQMEEDFERLAMDNAIAPPEEVKRSLKAQINSMGVQASAGASKVRSISKSKRFQRSFLVAASLAALLAVSSFWFYSRWQQAEETLKLVQEQTSSLQDRVVSLEKSVEESRESFRKINNPNIIPLLLEGNEISPQSRAIAYVNHATKEVIVNPQGLSPLDRDHAYQMWADVDGEMINMGLIPRDTDLVALKYIDDASSINITIEPAGGSEHPTVERLISSALL
ncbi:MAG: anti-sigma factor [Eudoraea sp.]|nr:anti-sigma factor [Eudoraea sp.]